MVGIAWSSKNGIRKGDSVKINIDAVNELLKEDFYGNYNAFSRELDVDASHLHRYLRTGIGGGRKIAVALLSYCARKQKDYTKYFLLDVKDQRPVHIELPLENDTAHDTKSRRFVANFNRLSAKQQDIVLSIIDEFIRNW